MKTSVKRFFVILCIFMPLLASAQKNIQSAFQAIIKCPEAKVTESVTLDKNLKTNIKTGESSVYSFSLPLTKKNLINNAIAAFDKDSEKTYSFQKGNAKQGDSSLGMAVGDNNNNSIRYNLPGYNYCYALFLAPKSEDPEGIHRYGYALVYKEGKDAIEGKMIVTYATTLMYRQKVEQERMQKAQQMYSNQWNNQNNQQNWFDQMIACFQGMPQANSQTRISLATKAYNLIKNVSQYQDVTVTDKNTIKEILKAMISDKEYSETVLNKLLNQCYNNLH